MPDQSIEAVQEAHTEAWMAIPGVVGTGIGRCDGEPCIVVYATERTERLEAELPDEVEGHRVRVEVTGQFRARDSAGG